MKSTLLSNNTKCPSKHKKNHMKQYIGLLSHQCFKFKQKFEFFTFRHHQIRIFMRSIISDDVDDFWSKIQLFLSFQIAWKLPLNWLWSRIKEPNFWASIIALLKRTQEVFNQCKIQLYTPLEISQLKNKYCKSSIMSHP